MRLPRIAAASVTPADPPPLESAQLDLEALVRQGALATQRLSPTQLPLLASRVDRMIRSDGEQPTWLVPLGSVLITLEASQAL